MRICFIGNSFTFANDLPLRVKEIAELAGVPMETASVARGGYHLYQYLDPETEDGRAVQNMLQNGPWDYVVLQDHSRGPIEERAAFMDASRKLCEMARAVGAVPVFYRTWAYRPCSKKLAETGMSFETMDRALREAYRAAADANDTFCVPVGEAFAIQLEAKDGADPLWKADDYHPCHAGTVLAAMTFCMTLIPHFKPVVYCPAGNEPLSPEEAEHLWESASQAFTLNFEEPVHIAKTADVHMRDPYILREDGKYYMTGTVGPTAWGRARGINCWVSEDLETWEGPYPIFRGDEKFWGDRQYWAPEMHKYNGSYYLFASFKAPGLHRGTQILKSDSPLGTFVPLKDYPVTPPNWQCLDGTLWVEDGVPYMVFCHEWVQVTDGTICAMPLTPDLKEPAGSPVLLFKGSDGPWTDHECWRYVTDGPFLYQTSGGKLVMLWSASSPEGYGIGYAVSEKGILGPWHQAEQALFNKDGGHGMIFTDAEGNLRLSIHQPNHWPYERPLFLRLRDTGDGIEVIKD